MVIPTMVLQAFHSRSGRILGALTILALCLCIVTDMLGMSAAVWNSVAMVDTLDTSLLEDPSILPAIPHLNLPFLIAFLELTQQHPHIPVLAQYLFHPPCFA